jgi:hypothetical protein
MDKTYPELVSLEISLPVQRYLRLLIRLRRRLIRSSRHWCHASQGPRDIECNSRKPSCVAAILNLGFHSDQSIASISLHKPALPLQAPNADVNLRLWTRNHIIPHDNPSHHLIASLRYLPITSPQHGRPQPRRYVPPTPSTCTH